MNRVACFVFARLSLQLLLKKNNQWQGQAVAVLADRPKTKRGDETLSLVNELAARKGLRPGMRLGAALDLVPTLRAAHVTAEEMSVCEEELGRALLQFSPRVEKARDVSGAPGVFFVDPSGLDRLYGGGQAWCRSVRSYFSARSFSQATVIGFGRYPTYALAQHGMATRQFVQVFSGKKAQFLALRQVQLRSLELSPKLLYELQLLGIFDVGALLALDPAELSFRLGSQAKELYESLCDRHRLPIQAKPPSPDLSVQIEVAPPDDHLERLLFGIKSALHDLIALVSAQGLYIRALEITFSYERGGTHKERLEPATPGRDVQLFVELVRLRFSDLSLQGAVSHLRLEAHTSPAEGDQLSLFDSTEAYRQGRPNRDLQAADRAIARLRAAYGPSAVQSFVLREGHLPEAQFLSTPQQSGKFSGQFGSPPVSGSFGQQKVRRLFSKPKRLHEQGGPRQFRVAGDRVVQLLGPYRVSGGWWNQHVERDYYYGQTERGALLWLYQDRVREAWFWQGLVD